MTDQAPISFDRPLWYLHADMWEPNKQTGQITSVDTHPTGRFATAGFDHCVRIWKFRQNPTFNLQISHQNDLINLVTQSKENLQIARSNQDDLEIAKCQNQLTLLQKQQKKLANPQRYLVDLLSEFSMNSPINTVRFSPNGQLLAIAADGTDGSDSTAQIQVWAFSHYGQPKQQQKTELESNDRYSATGSFNTETWHNVMSQSLPSHGQISDITWSPDSLGFFISSISTLLSYFSIELDQYNLVTAGHDKDSALIPYVFAERSRLPTDVLRNRKLSHYQNFPKLLLNKPLSLYNSDYINSINNDYHNLQYSNNNNLIYVPKDTKFNNTNQIQPLNKLPAHPSHDTITWLSEIFMNSIKRIIYQLEQFDSEQRNASQKGKGGSKNNIGNKNNNNNTKKTNQPNIISLITNSQLSQNTQNSQNSQSSQHDTNNDGNNNNIGDAKNKNKEYVSILLRQNETLYNPFAHALYQLPYTDYAMLFQVPTVDINGVVNGGVKKSLFYEITQSDIDILHPKVDIHNGGDIPDVYKTPFTGLFDMVKHKIDFSAIVNKYLDNNGDTLTTQRPYRTNDVSFFELNDINAELLAPGSALRVDMEEHALRMNAGTLNTSNTNNTNNNMIDIIDIDDNITDFANKDANNNEKNHSEKGGEKKQGQNQQGIDKKAPVKKNLFTLDSDDDDDDNDTFRPMMLDDDDGVMGANNNSQNVVKNRRNKSQYSQNSQKSHNSQKSQKSQNLQNSQNSQFSQNLDGTQTDNDVIALSVAGDNDDNDGNDDYNNNQAVSLQPHERNPTSRQTYYQLTKEMNYLTEMESLLTMNIITPNEYETILKDYQRQQKNIQTEELRKLNNDDNNNGLVTTIDSSEDFIINPIAHPLNNLDTLFFNFCKERDIRQPFDYPNGKVQGLRFDPLGQYVACMYELAHMVIMKRNDFSTKPQNDDKIPFFSPYLHISHQNGDNILRHNVLNCAIDSTNVDNVNDTNNNNNKALVSSSQSNEPKQQEENHQQQQKQQSQPESGSNQKTLMPLFINEQSSLWFRRPDWSPDGLLLAAPAGILNLDNSVKDDSKAKKDSDGKKDTKGKSTSNDKNETSMCDGDSNDKGTTTVTTTTTTTTDTSTVKATPWAQNHQKAIHCTHIFSRHTLNTGLPLLSLPSTLNEPVVAVCFNPIPFIDPFKTQNYLNTILEPLSNHSISSSKLLNKDNNDIQINPTITGTAYYYILAVATASCVTLYRTDTFEAISTVHHAHTLPITDLGWFHDGKRLVCTSFDGLCSTITFDFSNNNNNNNNNNTNNNKNKNTQNNLNTTHNNTNDLVNLSSIGIPLNGFALFVYDTFLQQMKNSITGMYRHNAKNQHASTHSGRRSTVIRDAYDCLTTSLIDFVTDLYRHLFIQHYGLENQHNNNNNDARGNNNSNNVEKIDIVFTKLVPVLFGSLSIGFDFQIAPNIKSNRGTTPHKTMFNTADNKNNNTTTTTTTTTITTPQKNTLSLSSRQTSSPHSNISVITSSDEAILLDDDDDNNNKPLLPPYRPLKPLSDLYNDNTMNDDGTISSQHDNNSENVDYNDQKDTSKTNKTKSKSPAKLISTDLPSLPDKKSPGKVTKGTKSSLDPAPAIKRNILDSMLAAANGGSVQNSKMISLDSDDTDNTDVITSPIKKKRT